MSNKVASLYAEISGDASGFKRTAAEAKKSLSDWSKQATLEAKSWQAVEKQKQTALAKTAREAEKAARDLERANKKASAESAQSFKNMSTVALVAFAAIAAGVKVAYSAFQEYAGSVRDLSLITGTGAEETSRFLQVIDDYELSANDATTATKALKEKGLVPTIDTLATLADRYKEIKDPAEKMKFIQDNLGKGGAKWVNILNQEGDALRQAAGEIDKNLVLTEEQIRQSEEARLAVDALGDSWMGLKVQTGAWIGTQILAIKHLKEGQNALVEYGGQADQVSHQGQRFGHDIERLNNQLEIGKLRTAFYAQGIQEIGTEAGLTEEELKELSKTNADMISLAMDLTKSNKDYQKSQDDTLEQIAELQAKKGELYAWETEKRDEIDEQISGLEEKYAEDAAAFEEASLRKLAMMTIEKIAMSDGVAGFSDAEAAKALAVAETAGAVEAASIREAVAFDQISTAIATSTIRARDLDAALTMMKKGYNIEVVIKTLMNMAQGAQAMSGGGSMLAANGGTPNGFADGGISSGPASGHAEMLHGTEAVIPLKNGSVPVQMQGGGDNSMLMAMIQALPDAIARSNRSLFEKVGRR